MKRELLDTYLSQQVEIRRNSGVKNNIEDIQNARKSLNFFIEDLFLFYWSIGRYSRSKSKQARKIDRLHSKDIKKEIHLYRTLTVFNLFEVFNYHCHSAFSESFNLFMI